MIKEKYIVLGSDHAGYLLKEQIKQYLIKKKINVIDCGTENTKRTDYPIFGKKVALLVSENSNYKGIVICGTGIGIAKSANLVKNIRCVPGINAKLVEHQVTSWDINVLSLGSRTTTFEMAQEMIEIFLNTSFKDINNLKYIKLIN